MSSHPSSWSEIVAGVVIDVAVDRDLYVLRAKEYGSRARNVYSDGSDVDVMIVFVQDMSDYVTKTRYVDTITETIGPDENDLGVEIEIHGWNLRKFVGGSDLDGHADGVLGSDPTACEFVASDVEHYVAPGTRDAWDRLDKHVSTQFKPYALMRHYASLAESNYRKYILDEDGTTTDRTTKRYLNVAQALCKRLLIEDDRSMPPMDANLLLRRTAGLVDDDVYARIGDLIARKKRGMGTDEPPRPVRETLDPWIEAQIEREVDPDGYVDRRPDADVVSGCVDEFVEVL